MSFKKVQYLQRTFFFPNVQQPVQTRLNVTEDFKSMYLQKREAGSAQALLHYRLVLYMMSTL